MGINNKKLNKTVLLMIQQIHDTVASIPKSKLESIARRANSQNSELYNLLNDIKSPKVLGVEIQKVTLKYPKFSRSTNFTS